MNWSCDSVSFFDGEENVLRLTVVMIEHVCECTKNHLIEHLK